MKDVQLSEIKDSGKLKVKSISENQQNTLKSENKKKSVKGKKEDKQSLTNQTKGENEIVLVADNECAGEANTYSLKQWIDLVNYEEGLKHIKKEWKNNVHGFQHQKIAEIIYQRNLAVNEIFKANDDKVKEEPSVARGVMYEDELNSEDFYLKHLIEDDVYDHETLNVDTKFIRDVHWTVSITRNQSKDNLIKDNNFKKNKSSKHDLDNIERKHLEEYNNTKVNIEKCERHKAPKELANVSKYEQHKHKCRNLLRKPSISLPVMKFKEALLNKNRRTHSHEKKNCVERTLEMLKNVKFSQNNLHLCSCEKCKKKHLCTNYQIKPCFNLSDVDILKKHINNVINRRKYPKFKLNNRKDHEINCFSDLKSQEKDTARNKKKDISLLEKENPMVKAITYEKREQLIKLNYGITSLSRMQKEQNEWDELIQKRMKGNPAWKSLSGKLESICNSVLYKPSSYKIEHQMKCWDEREIMDEFWKKRINTTNK